MSKLRVLITAALLSGAAALSHAQALRPEVAGPLQKASDLLKAGKAPAALQAVAEADRVSGKSGAEALMIERMRAAAAQRAGDQRTAIKSLQAIFDMVAGAEKATAAEQLAFAYSQAGDNGSARTWASKARSLGASGSALSQLEDYLLNASGDYKAIAHEAAGAVSAAEQAKRAPSEADLLRLADAQKRLNDNKGQTATLEKLVAYYPKQDYWAIYLARIQSKSGFSRRYGLDVLRLKRATGNLTTEAEYMEMSQLALQADLPAEGKAIVDEGFAKGVLGTGAQAERHKRLQALAVQRDTAAQATLDKRLADAQAARGGDELVDIGFALVTRNQAAKGADLIANGIAKGGLKRPDEAQLRLGQALLAAGKDKAKATKVLRAIQSDSGTADLGRLWALHGKFPV